MSLTSELHELKRIFVLGYDEMQQMSSQSDYGKQNYGVLQTQGKPTATGGPGSGMALGNNDMSSKYGGGMKVRLHFLFSEKHVGGRWVSSLLSSVLNVLKGICF